MPIPSADPHALTAAQPYVIHLTRSDALYASDYVELEQDHSTSPPTVINKPLNKSQLCHYQGYIEGVADSLVAVSTCNGVDGMLWLSDNVAYVIQPGSHQVRIAQTSKPSSVAQSLLAIQQPHTLQPAADALSTLAFHADEMYPTPPLQNATDAGAQYGDSADQLYIEYLVVNDAARYKLLGKDTETTTSAIMNVVSGIYSKTKLSKPISVVLTGQITWSNGDPFTPAPAADNKVDVMSDKGLLTLFNNWLQSNEDKLPAHDTAQLMSGSDFEGSVLGLATVGTICNKGLEGSVAEVKQPTTAGNAVIAAHETGHLLGASHDGKYCITIGVTRRMLVLC